MKKPLPIGESTSTAMTIIDNCTIGKHYRKNAIFLMILYLSYNVCTTKDYAYLTRLRTKML